MLKVKVTVPAACTGLGPGLDSLGLALALHNTFEFGLRPDSQMLITLQGEGDFPATMRHPSLRAAIALFQRVERAPAGFNVTITSRIPAGCGLGDLAALTIGGLVGANNLVDAPLKRDALIDLACTLIHQPTSIVTALLGGLAVSSGTGHELLYRRLDVAALKVVVIVPDVPDYRDPTPEIETVPFADASFNLGRTALVIEALRKSDFDLLSRAMLTDRVFVPHSRTRLPGYDAAVAAARAAGALSVALCSGGPALIAFTQVNHKLVEDAIQQAFTDAKIRVRAWTVNVDTQGVAISLMQ